MSINYYRSGQFNFICDVCGRKLKSNEAFDRWDGFKVCKDDWEPRHEQDLIRAPNPDKPIPWSRPEAADVFISITYSSSGVQDQTVPQTTFGTP